jgi:hypothetical protein
LEALPENDGVKRMFADWKSKENRPMHPCVTQTDPAFARSAAAGCWTPAQRSAVLASFLAWVFDAFDFFLMVFMMHAVATEFGTPVASVTWAIVPTLAMRPVVAFVFGRAAGWTGLICSYRHWRTTEVKQIFGVPKEKPGQRRGPAVTAARTRSASL